MVDRGQAPAVALWRHHRNGTHADPSAGAMSESGLQMSTEDPSQRRVASRYNVAWIAFAAFLAVLPLLVRGTSCGHDLSFHLLNWMEVVTQWQHGTLRPWWAFHAAFGAGEPRFVFYPPLSWVLGAVLGLVLPWAATPYRLYLRRSPRLRVDDAASTARLCESNYCTCRCLHLCGQSVHALCCF